MSSSILARLRATLKPYLKEKEIMRVERSLAEILKDYSIEAIDTSVRDDSNGDIVSRFLSAKKIEGRSPKTLAYYEATINRMIETVDRNVRDITTDDLRGYLSSYQEDRGSSKNTIDNIRRILSSFFSWLEEEDLVLKSPMRRIHKVKAGRAVKEVFSDEDLVNIRDGCSNARDLAMVDLLDSTGMRVGELVGLDRDDVDLDERECKVLGKGGSQRVVYFDARTKIHLEEYLDGRDDCDPALFVSLRRPYGRLTIGAVESRLNRIGKDAGAGSVHPHKFRRSMATHAIGKGMPIEQVQRLLGHVRIETTMEYAMVDQDNVKKSHRQYISRGIGFVHGCIRRVLISEYY